MKYGTISLLFAVVFLFALQASTSSLQARGQSPGSVVGNWTLSAASDRSGRDISFKMQNRRLEGTYVTSKGESKRISNPRFSRGSFYFEVVDLKLYFEMRPVKDWFEGKMTTYSTTEKRVPEPVKMFRKR